MLKVTYNNGIGFKFYPALNELFYSYLLENKKYLDFNSLYEVIK